MVSRSRKRAVKKPNNDFINFIDSLKEEREKREKRGKIDIVVLDQKKIEKNCGRGYLELFKNPLIEAERDTFLFIFREKEKRSSWYSEDRDRIVVNFAVSLRKQELREAVKGARELKDIERRLKSEKEKIQKR